MEIYGNPEEILWKSLGNPEEILGNPTKSGGPRGGYLAVQALSGGATGGR